MPEVKALVMHWTANAAADAEQNRNFFEGRRNGLSGYGSAHYIVGQKGEIIQCIPDDEIAYHCGSSRKDPESGKIYTDFARKKFGKYADIRQGYTPNFCTVGIELCNTDGDGNFTDATLGSAAELCAWLCRKFSLTADDITTHNAVVGWKDCPRLWTNRPELFEAFKERVRENLSKDGA